MVVISYVTPGSSNKKKEKEAIISNCYLDKVLKSGLSKFLKACLPQNLLSPILDTLSHLNLISCNPLSFVVWLSDLFQCAAIKIKQSKKYDHHNLHIMWMITIIVVNIQTVVVVLMSMLIPKTISSLCHCIVFSECIGVFHYVHITRKIFPICSH